jgi:hypothetical protein
VTTEVAKPPRVYPFAVEPNDVTRNRQRAGKGFRFGDYEAVPTHSKDGSHYWWLIDVVLSAAWWNEDGDVCVRGGRSFEEVTADFWRLFEE